MLLTYTHKNRTISEEEQGRHITAKADEIESAPMSAPAAELEMNVGIPRTESSMGIRKAKFVRWR